VVLSKGEDPFIYQVSEERRSGQYSGKVNTQPGLNFWRRP